MPEKVIRGNWIDRKTHDEVVVPSWEEFCGERDNKGSLWWVVNQLKSNPNGDEDPVAAVRKIFDDIRDLERNVWKKEPGEDRYTLWDCINALERHVWKKDGGEERPPILDRLDGVEKKLADLPNIVAECFRTAIQGELQPLLDSANANIDDILKANSNLKDTASSLSNEIGRHGERLETLEKQIRELPDKAKEVLLGSILAELQPRVDDLRNEIGSLHTKISSCQEELKQEVASRHEANRSLKQEINSLHSGLSSCQSGLEQKLTSAQEANSKLKADINSLRAELSTYQTDLKQELASAQEDIGKLKAEIDSLRKELSSSQSGLQQELVSAQQDIGNLKKENDSLRAELSLCQANLDAHLNPPKKQGFFERLFFKMMKFFQRKTSADTTTPSPKGS